MKHIHILLIFFSLSNIGFSQNDSIPTQDTNTYLFIKTDGTEIIGEIIREDKREILLLTADKREIYVPQHIIKERVLLSDSDFDKKGRFVGEDKFATRYFLTTNGLPIKKGEHYVLCSTIGPEIQFGLGKNFGVGVMTSWMGAPIIGTVKKSWKLGEQTQFAVGGLIGTGSWILKNWGGALPYATFSLGDRSKNLAISGGYGILSMDARPEGRAITSVAGMIKISPNFSLVFDSFIILPGQTETITSTYQEYGYNPATGLYGPYTVTNTYEYKKRGSALLIPGIRWHKKEGSTIQFGFAGLINKGEIEQIPVPMVQWFRSL